MEQELCTNCHEQEADIDMNICLDCLNTAEGECCSEWDEDA